MTYPQSRRHISHPGSSSICLFLDSNSLTTHLQVSIVQTGERADPKHGSLPMAAGRPRGALTQRPQRNRSIGHYSASVSQADAPKPSARNEDEEPLQCRGVDSVRVQARGCSLRGIKHIHSTSASRGRVNTNYGGVCALSVRPFTRSHALFTFQGVPIMRHLLKV
jgi:hypothetical protein